MHARSPSSFFVASCMLRGLLLFVGLQHLLARREPPTSLPVGGVDGGRGGCSWVDHAPRKELLLDFYRHAQAPIDCRRARLLVLDAFNSQSGMGFSFLGLHAIFMQSLAENRTLVASASLMRGHEWRWCTHDSASYGCYFEPWSRCEGDIGLAAEYLSGHRNHATTPQWDAASFGKKTLNAPVVRLDLTDDDQQAIIHMLYKKWTHCVPAIGRSWWWAATWDLLLEFQPFVQRAALEFLHDKSVRLLVGGSTSFGVEGRGGSGGGSGSIVGSVGGGGGGAGKYHGFSSKMQNRAMAALPDGAVLAEPFVVVIVRHGGKHVEEKLVKLSEYMRPLEKLMSPLCLGNRHVLLVTETASVVRNFSAACASRGWNCFWTDQRRMDLNIDPWNPGDPRNPHSGQRDAFLASLQASAPPSSHEDGAPGKSGRGSSAVGAASHPMPLPPAAAAQMPSVQGAFSSSSKMLDHIGWHSVLNLAIAQHGVALIGSFGSSWSQLTLSMMHRHHGGPVLGCSLRPGWKGDNIYTRFTPAGRPHTAYPLSQACRREMVGLCRGGELMYEGLGITWQVNKEGGSGTAGPQRREMSSLIGDVEPRVTFG